MRYILIKLILVSIKRKYLLYNFTNHAQLPDDVFGILLARGKCNWGTFVEASVSDLPSVSEGVRSSSAHS